MNRFFPGKRLHEFILLTIFKQHFAVKNKYQHNYFIKNLILLWTN